MAEQHDKQQSPRKRKRSQVFFYALGHNIFDIETVRELYRRENAPLVGLLFPEHGGGMYSMLTKRLWIGGQGSGGTSSEEYESKRYETEGGEGFTQLGYMVRHRGMFRIYPFVGFGGGGIELKRRHDESKLWDAAIGMVIVGLGIEMHIRRFVLGVRVGWTVATGATDDTLRKSMFYWRIIVGLERSRR